MEKAKPATTTIQALKISLDRIRPAGTEDLMTTTCMPYQS
jgi:hypothetical protein